MKFKIDKLQQQLNFSRNQLELERKVSREFRTSKANNASEKSELETFFLECIDEVKKDIKKRMDL